VPGLDAQGSTIVRLLVLDELIEITIVKTNNSSVAARVRVQREQIKLVALQNKTSNEQRTKSDNSAAVDRLQHNSAPNVN